MSSYTLYWKNFWMDRASPGHFVADEAYYDRLASEMRVLLGFRPFESVLEIGCGTGVFFKRLGFDKTRYTGVDFSPTMLKTFKQKYPDAPVCLCDDGATYEPVEPVDLIFSTHVIQNFSLRDLDDHLRIAARSVTPRGWIFHAGIPWNVVCWPWYRGLFAKGKPPSLPRAMAEYVLVRLGLRKSFGTWYSFETLGKVAAKHGLSAKFFGSLIEPFRFHVVLSKNSNGR